MIKAKTKYTLPIMLEYNKLQIKKRLPVIVITALIFVLGVAAAVIGFVVSRDNKATFVLFGILFWLLGGGMLLMNTAFPKSICKKLVAKNISVEYSFEEEEIKTKYAQNGTSTDFVDKLSSIKSVKESDNCFFVTINSSTIFIVDKSGIEGGADALRKYFTDKLPTTVFKPKEKNK